MSVDRAGSGPGAHGFLPAIRVVFARETGAYFDSSIAYVHLSAFLLLAHGMFMNSFFLDSVLELGEYFQVLPFLLALFIPAITMRAWAEERAQGTFETLLTLPLRSFEVILGKYLAALLFYLLALLGSFPLVLLLFSLGEPDTGLLAASYLGAVLLGALFLSLGLLISSLTREQIVAFVGTTFACALLLLSGHDKVVEVIDGLAPTLQAGTWIADSFSVLPRYQAFLGGLVQASDLAYFGLLTVFFLCLNEVTVRLARC